jgi:hypothetical protein
MSGCLTRKSVQVQVRQLRRILNGFRWHTVYSMIVMTTILLPLIILCFLASKRVMFGGCGKWRIAIVAAIVALLILQAPDMISDLSAMKPGVAVMGEVGVGKSTLCNVVASCMAGNNQLPCAAGHGSESFTVAETEVLLGEAFRFMDTPGDIVHVRLFVRTTSA